MVIIEQLQADQLNGIYRDIAVDLGVEVAILLFEHYRGLQIVFPTRLLSKEYLQKKILQEHNGSNVKALARKYNYTERWVRQIIKRDKTVKD
ncbi:Mor transcription activator family protein [Oscillospiraceae bacterium PP1C4]